MAKNVPLIVSGAGWIADFAGKLVEGLRSRGVSDEEIHSLVTSKGRLAMDKIVEAVAELARQAKNVFRLIRVSASTEDLVRDGRYNYANPNVTSINFPLRHKFMGPREIIFLEFDRDVSSEEVLAEAKRQNLEWPVYEDALRFGVEHSDVQRERPVVFLHESWRDPFVLSLWGDAGSRRLVLDWFGRRWGRDFRFAFVRK